MSPILGSGTKDTDRPADESHTCISLLLKPIVTNMASELHLWDHPTSSFAQKVRIVLREKSIPFSLTTPKGAGSGDSSQCDSSFAAENHRLQVPTLVDRDFKIFDSTVILEYIEDKYPEPSLRSPDPKERARARMIEDVCDSQGEAINWGMGEIEGFRRASGDRADQMRAQAVYQMKQFHEWLVKQLSGKQWFGGSNFGLADACVWPIINRSTSYGLQPEEGTELSAWYERCKQRNSIKTTLQEFEESVKGRGDPADALKKGLIRREYRDHRLEWMIKSGGIDLVREGMENSNVRFSWPAPLP